MSAQTPGQEHFDGIEPPGPSYSHVSLIGATFDLDDLDFALGTPVEFAIKGHVVLDGVEDKKGVLRRVAKIEIDDATRL
jgi:hypothetical protein